MKFSGFSHEKYGHESVLLQELIASVLTPHDQRIIFDGTLGLGGHSEAILHLLHAEDILLATDWDIENLRRAQERLRQEKFSAKYELIHSSYTEISALMAERNIPHLTGCMLDLGISSAHVDDGEAGFSFQLDGPLDMRYDRTGNGKTAEDLVMTSTESQLFDIFSRYGEEPKTPYIVAGILAYRKQNRIDTTFKLREIIRSSSYDPKSVVRIFQAIRIALNEEFDNIRQVIQAAVPLLVSGGRLSIITFHSSEDRLVKHLLAPYLDSKDDEITGQVIVPALCKKIYKKPLLPGQSELENNPRARSAKLRCIEKN